VTDMDCHTLIRWSLDSHRYQCHYGVNDRWRAPISALPGHSDTRPKQRPAGWNGPHSTVCDASGRLFVTCYYTPSVVSISPNGVAELLVGPYHLSGPASSSLVTQGRFLVAEYAKNLVMAFGAGGKYLGRLGREANGDVLPFDCRDSAVPPSDAPSGFDRPHMAVTTPDGCILVADTWNNRIQKFSSSGSYQCQSDDLSGWKTEADRSFWKRGRANDCIPCPVAIDQDSNGRILVTAWGSNQLFLLESDGRGAQLPVPATLCKPYDARFYRDGVVIADTHNGRVLIVEDISQWIST
jgi:hypothetical protein